MEKTFHMLLYRAFHAQRNYLRPYLNEIGLEVGQPKLLGCLYENGPCRQSQLANYFEIDSAAVSRMVDALERGGFVTRQPDAQSRRCNLVGITEKGKETYLLWKAHCKEMEGIMLQGFTEEEKMNFSNYLFRVYQNFRQRQEGDLCKI